jgi:hypothetical protein
MSDQTPTPLTDAVPLEREDGTLIQLPLLEHARSLERANAALKEELARYKAATPLTVLELSEANDRLNEQLKETRAILDGYVGQGEIIAQLTESNTELQAALLKQEEYLCEQARDVLAHGRWQSHSPSPGKTRAESQNKTSVCTSHDPQGESMGVLAEHSSTCESALLTARADNAALRAEVEELRTGRLRVNMDLLVRAERAEDIARQLVKWDESAYWPPTKVLKQIVAQARAATAKEETK